jgi:hypothetical protein
MLSSGVPDAVIETAGRLAPAPIAAVEEVRKGGNSRVFKIRTPAGDFALKKYPAGDRRDRQGAEARALQFFARVGIAGTPTLVGLDTVARMSLLSWLEGSVIAVPNDADIEQFAAFQIHLDQAIDARARREIDAAAEACIAGARILSHIRARYDRLAAASDRIPELHRFLQARFQPAWAEFEERARRIYQDLGLDFEADQPQQAQTLIASDFGTHNALRSPDGRVSFVDFEYFGWDDPLTSIGNFVLHPGMQLTSTHQDLYQSRLLAHFGSACANRLAGLLPLFALRWCAIVVSDLLPERRKHRSSANVSNGTWEEIRDNQIAKANHLLAQFDRS